MGDRHHGARVLLEGALEPRHRLGVEVVGRLVEQEEVGLGQQEPAEGHPPALPTREGTHLGVPRWEPKGVHGDLEGALEVPGPRRVDLGLQLALLGDQRIDVGLGVTEGGADLVVAVDQRLGLADTPSATLPATSLARSRSGSWGKKPTLKPGVSRASPLNPSSTPAMIAQQRGLARPVRPDDADLRPGVEGEVDAPQHLAVGRVEARRGRASCR